MFIRLVSTALPTSPFMFAGLAHRMGGNIIDFYLLIHDGTSTNNLEAMEMTQSKKKRNVVNDAVDRVPYKWLLIESNSNNLAAYR